MFFLIVASIFLTILQISSVTHGLPQNFAFPSSYLQSQCQISNTGQPGICKPYNTCINVQNDWLYQRIDPTTCYFDQFNPIVCCPLDNQNQISSTTTTPFIPTLSPIRTPIPSISPERDNIVLKQRISQKICDDNYYSLSKSSDKNDFHISVVGGKLTDKGEFPFMAASGWINIFNDTEFNCGGFLVSPNFILTAAHCTILGGASPDIVRIGDDGLNSTTNSDSGTSPSEYFALERIFVHPNYNAKETYNDIALIKLSSNARVKPICLWQSNNITGEYSEAEAIGYGHTQFAGARSIFLMKVTLGLIENLECSKSYPPAEKFPQGILNSQLCAGDPTKDTCQGDSGGPIVVRNLDSTPYAIGITSFGSGCAGGIPSIYTRISFYLDWIESVIWPDG